ncbi:MAG: 6,7-dimethyl-8-ribityllumazine synthase [Alphaproteobacteria bacterium]
MPHSMIVVSPYYEEISAHLLEGAKAVLKKENWTYEVFEVPGALEIPLALRYGVKRKEGRGAGKLKFDAFVALGCVIRGQTSHYDIVCNESARGLYTVSLEYGVPVGNGILTCENREQALERAHTDKKNKGAGAAQAAIDLFNLSMELEVYR